jgi:SOS-response transcriptional repressor LexA
MLVVGDSMTGDDIHDGDFIVIDQGRHPEDGDIAVVQFTTSRGPRGPVIKHVRTGAVCVGDRNGLLLESSNPADPPNIITPDADPVIEGLVVGVARRPDGRTWTYFRIGPD